MDPFGLVGKVIGGKYRVQALVEETALSVVYRAVHRVWQRPVAIKAFKSRLLDVEDRARLLESFIREGRLLMELSERCAAIVQARDVASLTTARGEWVPYMVLEWLEGESLEAMVTRERANGARLRVVAEAMRLLDPVARALTLAHERGITHRDVKPANVFVLAGGCKLLDFGVAAVAHEVVREGECRSFTPAYGAPEQYSPDIGATGPWTDVFALGLVLVELVTGRDALGSGTIAGMMRRSCDPDVRPTPRALGASVHDDVERVMARALAVQPEHRYANAGELWSALRTATPSPWVDLSGTIPIPLVRRRQWRLPWQRGPQAGGSKSQAVLASEA
ncbi:MAG TPA: serine/threonine-protein kinase [Polyangiaceae bacterium]|jgi:serine/threonine protein kinase